MSTPFRVNTPPGYQRLEINHRLALSPDIDVPWVTAALTVAGPTSRAATRSSFKAPKPLDISASDLAAGVHARRDEVCKLLVAQLAMPDPSPAAHFVDTPLTRLVDQVKSAHVQMVYLITTQAALKALVQSGWGATQFHYNRVADKVIFDGEVQATLTGDTGDSLLPVIVTPEQSPPDRTKTLREAIDRTETGVDAMISRQGLIAVQTTVGEFILTTALAPLHLDNDQDWFDAGVTGWLSALVTADLIDEPADDLIKALSEPNPYNPVSADSVDLGHPLPREQLRPQLVAAYADTFRRRSVHVVAEWLTAAGEDALPKTIAAIREKKPADNAALLAVIKGTTGTDLTAKLAPAN